MLMARADSKDDGELVRLVYDDAEDMEKINLQAVEHNFDLLHSVMREWGRAECPPKQHVVSVFFEADRMTRWALTMTDNSRASMNHCHEHAEKFMVLRSIATGSLSAPLVSRAAASSCALKRS